MKKKLKSPRQSKVVMTEMVLPQHTNALGGVFGGVIMSWIDIAAAICAQRHSGRTCVTASIDDLHFLNPVKEGMVVNIDAQITCVNTTSCEILVTIGGENPFMGEKFKVASAYLTFVSLDSNGHPASMPGLKVSSEKEKKLLKEAKIRRNNRFRLKKKLKESQ